MKKNEETGRWEFELAGDTYSETSRAKAQKLKKEKKHELLLAGQANEPRVPPISVPIEESVHDVSCAPEPSGSQALTQLAAFDTLARTLNEVCDKGAEKTPGMTPSHLFTLLYLHNCKQDGMPEMRLDDLCLGMGLSKPNLSLRLSKLQLTDLIDIKIDKQDRRARLIKISKSGTRVILECEVAVRELLRSMYDSKLANLQSILDSVKRL